jgi:molybdopterin/thiamine biosynthesis adenylyltransferase
MMGTMGFRNVWVRDPDTVEWGNLPTQGWNPWEVGKSKVNAVIGQALDRQLYLEPEIAEGAERPIWVQGEEGCWGRGDSEGKDVVFCCVDSMASRKSVLSACRRVGVPLFIEGRMQEQDYEVYGVALGNDEAFEKYQESLFDDGEVVNPGRCTIPMTLWGGWRAAATMLGMFMNWGVSCGQTGYCRVTGSTRYFVETSCGLSPVYQEVLTPEKG